MTGHRAGRPGPKMMGDPNRCYCWDIRLPLVHTLDDHWLFDVPPNIGYQPEPIPEAMKKPTAEEMKLYRRLAAELHPKETK